MKVRIDRISARDLLFHFSKISSIKLDLPIKLYETFRTECAKDGMEPEEVLKRFVRDYLKDTKPYWDFSDTHKADIEK